jgi:hypothetical protein
MVILRDRRRTGSKAWPELPKTIQTPPAAVKKSNPKSELEAAREKFRLRGKSWQMSAGAHTLPDGSRVVWLEQRQKPQWGIGCALCAQLSVRLSMLPEDKKARRQYSTKWSRFEINGNLSMQTSCIRKHAASDAHLGALRLFQLPATATLFPSKRSDSDEQLLRHGVPQPSDWLQAWAQSSRVGLSSRGSEKLSFTDQFIYSSRLSIKEIERRAFSKMRDIMQEVIRERKRSELQAAVSICLSTDDKSPYRLVRFKCVDVNGKISKGIVGLIVPTKALQSDPRLWDEDKSVLAAESVVSTLRDLCRGMTQESQSDPELFNQVCTKVRIFCADGAPYVQKTGRILKERFFPQVCLICRDVAHMLRMSYKEPLLAEEVHGEAWRLISGAEGPRLP